MVHYDHGLLGATLALAVGAERRLGWAGVVLAALAAMVPDWDALYKHIDYETYVRTHRVWGHNVFAVALAGILLGMAGYLITHSTPRGRALQPHGSFGYWIILTMIIALTHPLMDVLYCGLDRDADWPVALFWPLKQERFGQPWIPWSDNGATLILFVGLTITAFAPIRRQRWACISMIVFTSYVALRGALR